MLFMLKHYQMLHGAVTTVKNNKYNRESDTYIAAATGIDVRRIQRVLNEMRKAGFVRTEAKRITSSDINGNRTTKVGITQ